MRSNNIHEATAVIQEKNNKQVAFVKVEVVKMERSGWI